MFFAPLIVVRLRFSSRELAQLVFARTKRQARTTPTPLRGLLTELHV
jgi:hypothetical protein